MLVKDRMTRHPRRAVHAALPPVYRGAPVRRAGGRPPRLKQKHIRLEGSVPSAANPPSGCHFHTRCPRKIGVVCETEAPPWRDAGEGHRIYCHIPLDELRTVEPVVHLVTH